MAKVKSVTELKNYDDLLKYVQPGEPLLLTKNAKCRYCLLDMDDYESLQSQVMVLENLVDSIESDSEFTIDDVKKILGI